jgi:hypothetical protein
MTTSPTVGRGMPSKGRRRSMRLYEIQWIGPPRPGGAEIIDRVIDIAPDDDAVKEHARHLFATIQNP